MLILSRKLNESIVISGNIKVKICRIDRETVKLGIEAPKEIEIFREEVLKRRVDNREQQDGQTQNL